MTRRPRPTTSFSSELQHERTALAWERTAFSIAGLGVILARFAAVNDQWLVVPLALTLVAVGAALVVWGGAQYEDRHLSLREGQDVVHPGATRLVGVITVAACSTSLVAAVVAIAQTLG